jgi:hypothetical protein
MITPGARRVCERAQAVGLFVGVLTTLIVEPAGRAMGVRWGGISRFLWHGMPRGLRGECRTRRAKAATNALR